MIVENGKFIYFVTTRFDFLIENPDGTRSIVPTVVKFKLTLGNAADFDISKWFDVQFTGKLLLNYGTDENEVASLRQYFKDFLYVDSQSVEYISTIVYTILTKTYPNQQLEAISYEQF